MGGWTERLFLARPAQNKEPQPVRYRVLIEQDEDGVYVAEAPSLPGCVSQGRTRAQAIENIKEAIAGYIESLQAHDEPIPQGDPDIPLHI